MLPHQFLIRATVWMGKQLWRDKSAVSRGGRGWRGGTEVAISNPCSGWDSEWIWKVSRNSISNPWTCPVLSLRTHTRFHLMPPKESRLPVKLLQRRMQTQRKWNEATQGSFCLPHISNSGFSMRIRQFPPLRAWQEIIILLYSWSLSIKSLLCATQAFFSEFY